VFGRMPDLSLRRDRAGLIAAGLLATAFAVVGVLRWANWWAGAIDLGIFDQGIWLMSRGHAPEVSIVGDNLFADHLSAVLFLYVPLYRLVATPLWLIASQAVCLGLTVLPLRALARDLGAPPWLATAGVCLSAPLFAAAVYDFHPVAMAAPAVAWAILAGRRDDVRGVTWAAIAVAVLRADAVVLLLGAAVLSKPAARRRLLLMVPIPLLAGLAVPAALGSRQTFERYYGQLGDDPVDALLHPWRVVTALLSQSSFDTLVIWLLPVGFLTLLRPRWAAAMAVAGAPLLMSTWPGTSLPWFHHGAALVPFTVGGMLAAVATWPSVRPRLVGLSLAGAVTALLVASPLSPRAPAAVRVGAIVAGPSGEGLGEAVAAVAAGESVSSNSRVLARLAHRPGAWLYPCPFRPDEADEGFCPGAAPDRADDVDVVIVGEDDLPEAERLGYRPMDDDTGGPGPRAARRSG
jgi:uncharacterized membrane protein